MTIFDLLQFIGGLALFLYGMNYMGTSLERLSGGKLETMLEKMTSNRLKGLLLGVGVTAVIQSSSAVTVMAVGFVNSKIMTLHQVVGIIMGANIGTTITSWLLSLTGIEGSNIFIKLLKPSSFAPVIAIIGVFLLFSKKNEKKKNIGAIMLGFATLMFGMDYMSSAVEPLKDVPQFTGILTMFSNPILGILAGALLTAVIQSSSASVGILQALAVTGSITVSSAFPIILGQNIGTCITALISSVGTSKNGKRTAVIHLIFNALGVAAAMIIFYALKGILKLPLFEEGINAGSIAAIHTTFNVFSTVLLFPFGKWLEKLACIIIPNGKDENSELIDEKFVLSNAYAIDKAKEQCNTMAETALENTILSLNILKKYSSSKNSKITENEQILDKYEDELETYLVKISAGELNLNNSVRLSMLSHAIGNFERIGDYAYNILRVKQQMHRDKIHFSREAYNELEIMSNAVKEIAENSVSAFINDDADAASRIEPLEQVIDNLKVQIKAKHSKRMENTECSIENGILFFDIINSLERIADHCSNLAFCIIELSQKSYRIHQYSKGLKNTSSSFMETFEEYCEKYSLA